MIRNFQVSRFLSRVVLLSLFAGEILPAMAQSPFTLSRSLDGPLLGISAGIGGLTLIAGERRNPLTDSDIMALDPANVNAFDYPAIANYSPQKSDLSDFLVTMMLMLPAGLMTSKKIRADAWTIGVMYTEVVVLANLGPQIFKVTTPRVRPYGYNPAVPMSEKTTVYTKESFFSGHTANAFASAVFLSGVHAAYFPGSGSIPYVWAGSLGLAAFIGYLRYSSGKHFPTDILTGALWGSAVGFLIPRLHRSNNDATLGWVPVVGNNSIGGYLSLTF